MFSIMQKDSRFFDDIARLASGAASTMGDMKREVEAIVMDKLEKILYRANLVRREEFEIVQLMLEKARLEQEKLAAEIAGLKKRIEDKPEKSHKAK